MIKMERGPRLRWIGWILVGLALFASACLIALAAFPVGLFKDRIARHIGARFTTNVSIGSIGRREAFSFTPTIVIRDLAIRQPRWAGSGNMVQAQSVEVRISILSLMTGGGARPDSAVARGLSLALVRDASGRANWEGPKDGHGSDDQGSGLGRLLVPDGRLSLKDARRALLLSGTFASDGKGLRIDAAGRFHNAPARLAIRGASISGQRPDAAYPIELKLQSPLLRLDASGQTRGPLNLRSMSLDVRATSPNLKYLDDVIEAGLFGTQPIDLHAKVRHAGRDWFVEHLTGRIGRSPLVAKADILKRDERTKIDADVHFGAFDFDDLSDAQGKAKARAIEASIGPRVLPGTRINLAKVGPTDGVVRFKADRLLLTDSVFRSLAGTIRLTGKLLELDDIHANMSSGRMIGAVRIDQRGGVTKPYFAMDLLFTDGRLEKLIGTQGATGSLRGRVKLSGAGNTIREALGRADGHAGLVVRDGQVKRTLAAVLGQDLGKAIGAALRNKDAEIPLRCLAIDFAAKGGILTPSPFLVDTSISSGTGQGTMSLATERIALTIRGRSRDPSGLRLVDPIRVGGSFSAPTLSAAGDPPGSKVGAGSIIKAVGKSIGGALGLSKKRDMDNDTTPMAVDCASMERRILAARPPRS
jgi:uncharacterized protein involved in outer membrane biogenesis